MKNRNLIFLFSALTAYLIIIVSIITGLQTIDLWYGIIVSIIMMIVAVIFHLFGKKQKSLYLISFLFNSIGTGLAISAFYSVFELTPGLQEMIIASAIGLVILVIFIQLLSFDKIRKYKKLFVGILIFLLLLTSTLFWIKNQSNFSSIVFFFLYITYFYMIGVVRITTEDKHILKDISSISFGFAIAVGIVVIMILSEGEALEGLDGLSIGSNKNKNNI